MDYTYFIVHCDLYVQIIPESELSEWKDYSDARVLRTKNGEVEAWHYAKNKWVTEPAKKF